MSQPTYIIVITTCGDETEAGRLAALLVESRLAACVQGNRIQSVYRWQGRIEDATEVRLMIKARYADYAEIENLIQEFHSYANPEIIGIPVVAGSDAYLNWIWDETRREIE